MKWSNFCKCDQFFSNERERERGKQRRRASSIIDSTGMRRPRLSLVSFRRFVGRSWKIVDDLFFIGNTIVMQISSGGATGVVWCMSRDEYRHQIGSFSNRIYPPTSSWRTAGVRGSGRAATRYLAPPRKTRYGNPVKKRQPARGSRSPESANASVYLLNRRLELYFACFVELDKDLWDNAIGPRFWSL